MTIYSIHPYEHNGKRDKSHHKDEKCDS